ncbi:MAG TPA: phosphoenolpyruvate--protein phosphotransferase [Myxococcota bacterium]|nr:phosphoenolpyruvate--protein phosphotransferase [Myxococcota bacterium]
MKSKSSERRGVPVSPGIAIGPAYVLRRERIVIPEHRIRDEQADGEVERLRMAFAETRTKLEEIRRGMHGTGLVGTIFDAQFLFLEDPTLLQHAEANIREQGLNAEWALQRELRRLEELFESLPDPYLRERASDIGFIVRRVLQALMGREPEGLRNAPAGVIVVAEDLSPGEVAQVTRDRIAGFVTESGSRTSHVTIMARSLEIPAVVGAGAELAREVPDGVTLILDGRTGRVIVDPDPSQIAEYQKQLADLKVLSRELFRYVDLPAETKDGVAMRLLANVDQIEEARDALRYGAEGIGLYRTEFLFLNRHDLPGEDEQCAAYSQILAAVAPYSATIRTLDIGGEKVPTGLDLSDEANPALGLRGMRMSHQRPDVFRTQVRALLRSSTAGKLKILLPMVSSLAEVEYAREALDAVKRELARERVAFDRDVPLGVMIETPAAAMIVDLIAPHADFLSIGTNDLLQYTLAVDRSNEQVAYLYEPLHPAHLRMLQRIGQAARRAGIVVGMCGEMAGDPLHIWILMALGMGELSMAPFAIPLLKRILRDSTAAEARELLTEVLKLGGPQEIRQRVERRMRERFPVEFERIALQG